MPIFDLLKETFRMLRSCDKMPLHFVLIKPVHLHGSVLHEGRYDFISHDSLENKFIYRSRLHKTISISLKDYEYLRKSKLIGE